MSAVDVTVAERGLRRRSRFSSERGAWLLFLPAMLPILIFSVWPLMQGIALGFTNATAARNATVEFTGVENYVASATIEAVKPKIISTKQRTPQS